MDEEIEFHPGQEEIANSRNRFRVVNCGRRFGKTFMAVEEMKTRAMFVIEYPEMTNDEEKNKELIREYQAEMDRRIKKGEGARIAYIATTHQQARDISWKDLKKVLRGMEKNINETRLEITVNSQIIDPKTKLPLESTIVLRGWESVETLRGQHFDFLVIDEVAMMRNFWSGWNEVLMPTLLDNSGSALFLSTPKGFNHFYELYNKEAKDKDYKSFHFTTYDNPHIPKKDIEAKRLSTPDDAFAQEYLAEFRKMQGLVYPEFSREIHLINEKELESLEQKEWAEITCGVDFGYTNPAAILLIKRDKDNVYWVTDEWYKTQRTTAQIVERVKHYGPHTVYPDPAEPDRIEEMRQAGVNVRDVNKDIVAGVDRVRELLKQGRVKIHPNCENLIYELETYHYPDSVFGRNEQEKPVKENDHALDALRYVLFSNNLESYMYDMKNEFKLYDINYD